MLALSLNLIWEFPLAAQAIPDLNWSKDDIRPESYIPVFNIGNLEISPVFLDGTMIGTIESFIQLGTNKEDGQANNYSSAVRSHIIHSKLQKILDNMNRYSREVLPQRGISGLEEQARELKKQLITDVSEQKGAAVVLIAFPKNEVPEIIYTVTQATVARPRFGGSQSLKIAERAAKVAYNSLIQAWKERQPPHLRSQAKKALHLFLALTVTSLTVA